MATRPSIEGGASASPNFDPSHWLDAFANAGGGYVLTSDRKLSFLVGAVRADVLAATMGQIVTHPDRQEAIKRAIESRQHGGLSA